MDYNTKLNAFWNFSCDAYPSELSGFSSVRGRISCFRILLQKISFLPISLLLKAVLTLFRGLGLGFGLIVFIMTLGSSKAQEFFFRRSTAIAKDVMEWIVFPFIVLMGLFRLFIGSTLHPAVYFR